jgi:hypothetical protein
MQRRSPAKNPVHRAHAVRRAQLSRPSRAADYQAGPVGCDRCRGSDALIMHETSYTVQPCLDSRTIPTWM